MSFSVRNDKNVIIFNEYLNYKGKISDIENLSSEPIKENFGVGNRASKIRKFF